MKSNSIPAVTGAWQYEGGGALHSNSGMYGINKTMIEGFDVASVAATARFLASGAQPFAALDELATITAPALVVPGEDATHPAALAGRYAEHLVDCRVRAVPAGAIAGAVAALCEDLPG